MVSITWKALALLKDVLESRLEEAVGHLVSVAVISGEVLQRDLVLRVAVALGRGEPGHRVL